jgi:4-amino-4-deoxy-L-arabinose transferase-like glycosyltransferase
MKLVTPNSVSNSGAKSSSAFSRRLQTIALVAAVLAYLVLAFSISWTRVPIDDDAFYASAPYNLYAHGFTGTTVYEPAAYPFPGVEQRTYTYPPLYIVTQATWYKLVGFGIEQMRLSSTLWGLLLLAAWFVVVRKLVGNSVIATITVCLLAIDYSVMMSASLGRMSMMAAALAIGSLAFYLSLRTKNLGSALLVSNTCAVLAGLTHPLAGVLAVVNLFFLVIWFDRRNLRLKHGLFVALPYVVGAVGWGLYIAKDPAMFWAQFSTSASQGRRLGGLANPIRMVTSEVSDRYLAYYGFSATKKDFRILLLLSYLAGALFALFTPSIRRAREYRVLGIMTVLSFITMAVIEGTRQRVYMVHTIPFLVVWVAVSIYWLWSRGKFGRPLAIAFATIFVLLHVAAIGYRVKLNPYAKQYMPVVEYIRPTARAGGFIIGPAPLRFGLGFDTNLVFDPDLGAVSGKVPDLIVLDDQSRLTMESEWATDPVRGAKARAVLERYHPVYSRGEYEIYAPNQAR